MSKWKNHRQARTHEDGLRPVTCHCLQPWWCGCPVGEVTSWHVAEHPWPRNQRNWRIIQGKVEQLIVLAAASHQLIQEISFNMCQLWKGLEKKIPNACCSTSALQISHWNVSWAPSYFLAYSGENSGKHNSACPSWHRNKLLVYAVTQMNLRSTMASEEAYHKRL